MERLRSSLGQPLNKKLRALDEDLYFTEEKKKVKGKKMIENIKENWIAGLTVGLVNLPLCIALAVASGSTPSAGILSGIIGGIVHGIFGGSNFNIVGPTGALSGFLSSCVFRYGIDSLPYFSMVAGLLTLVARKYGLQKHIDLFPVAVNEGFTLGIALIIIFNQINPALGIGKIEIAGYVHLNTTTIEKITKEVVHSEQEDSLIYNVVNNLKHINQMNIQAVIIFFIFLIALFFLLKHFPLIPWHAVIAAIGILIGYSGKFQIDTLHSKFGDIKLNLSDFSYTKLPPIFLLNPSLWVDALPIAFIAVLETLISAKIADGLTNSKFDKSNEMKGLGYSNILSGFLGGVPITAALARTTLNIKSGATHRIASVINGIILFIIAFTCISFFKFLPLCASAAQVSIVAIRMVNFEEVKVLYKKDRSNFVILISTAVICILRDPTVGIIFGLLIYFINFNQNLTHPWTEVISTHESQAKENNNFDPTKSSYLTEEIKDHGKVKQRNYLVENLNMFISDLPKGEGDYILYRIIGIINFMNVSEHIEKLNKFAANENVTVVISFRYVHFIDIEAMHAIKHLLDSIAKEKRESFKNIHNRFVVTGLNKNNTKVFKDKEWITDLYHKDMLIFREQKDNYFEA